MLARPHLPQFGEGAAALAQLLGRPALHDPPVLHDRDLVSHGHLGQPVGDQQGRPFPADVDGGPVEGSRARASGFGRCLIQDDDLGIGQQGPCQRHLLGLGRGEPGSQSSHQSVDAIGQIPHPFGTDLFQSLHDGLANLVVRPVLGGGW